MNYNNPQSLHWKTTCKYKPLHWFQYSFPADNSNSTKLMYQCQHCTILYTSSVFLYLESRLIVCVGYVTFQSPWTVVLNGLRLPTYNLTSNSDNLSYGLQISLHWWLIWQVTIYYKQHVPWRLVQINLAVIIQHSVATQGCMLTVTKLRKWPSFRRVYLRMDIFQIICAIPIFLHW